MTAAAMTNEGPRALRRMTTRVLLAGAIGFGGVPMLGAGLAHAAVENAATGVRFRYSGSAGSVSLAGDFNGWSTTATPMTKNGDAYEAVVAGLTSGEHQYKFVVDGNWIADADNPRTGGDFGNSVITVGADGKLAGTGTAATASVGGSGGDAFVKAASSVNPKVQIDGRYVATYVGVRDRVHNEWNVVKPGHNLDLVFNVQMNSNMTARLLTNVNGTHENTEPWRVHSNFDRGRMDLRMPRWSLTSFDNDGVVTVGDSLHTFGDVGIYHYAFGFNNSGLQVGGAGPLRSNWWVLYTDRNADGTRPSPVGPTVQRAAASDSVSSSSAVDFATYAPGSGTRNENTAGAGVTLPLAAKWNLSGTFRNARGANLTEISTLTPGDSLVPASASGLVTGVRTTDGDYRGLRQYSTAEARSLGAGTLTWRGYGRSAWLAAGISRTQVIARQEYLYRDSVAAGELNASLTPDITRPGTQSWNLSRSFRLQAGMNGRLAGTRHGTLGATLEHERHRYSTLAFGGLRPSGPAGEDTVDVTAPLTSRRTTLTVHISAPIRRLTLGLDVRDEIFRYADGTPWGAQLWFAGGNAWLDEHVLSVSRYTLLGGRAAVIASPRAQLRLGRRDGLTLEYRGTLAGAGAKYKPSFTETRTLLTWKATDHVTVVNDNRAAHYNSTQPDVHHTYWSNFAEVRYNWTQQISVELGVGVDPDVLDPVPNEYRDIGRDLYLFGQGATESAARTNYRRFGAAIDAAERALSRERRVQLEAKLAF